MIHNPGMLAAGSFTFTDTKKGPDTFYSLQNPTLPGPPKKYVFDFGYGATEDSYVGELPAVDPEGGSLTYTITAGNTDGYFKFSSYSGWLQAAKNLPLDNTLQYTLTVSVSDGTLTDTAIVEINLNKQMVVVTGDTQGTETGDPIRLEVVRLAKDVTAALSVTIEVEWVSASRTDLQDATLLLPAIVYAPGATKEWRTVTIPAGADRFTLPNLLPQAIAGVQGRRAFYVSIVPSTGGDYVLPPSNTSFYMGSLKPGFKGAEYVTCEIYDGITPFVRGMADGRLSDVNDIRQGSVGDCWYLAALGEMAVRKPDELEDMIQPNADGTYTIKLYDSVGAVASEEIVTLSLDFDIAQAKVGDDVDAAGNREVWPILFEKAYRQHFGFNDLHGGGTATKGWQKVTGQPATTLYTNDFATDAVLRTRIENEWTAGKMICFGTWGASQKSNWKYTAPEREVTVVSNHVYAVKNVTAAGVLLYNPHGNELPFTLTWDSLKAFLGDVYVQ